MKKFKTKFTHNTQVRVISHFSDEVEIGTNGNVILEPTDSQQTVGVNIKGVKYNIPQDVLITEKEYIIDIQTNQLRVWKHVLTAVAYEKLVEYATKDNNVLHANGIVRGTQFDTFLSNYARSICK